MARSKSGAELEWWAPSTAAFDRLELGGGRFFRHADAHVVCRATSSSAPFSSCNVALKRLVHGHALRMLGCCLSTSLAFTCGAAELLGRCVHAPEVEQEATTLRASLAVVQGALDAQHDPTWDGRRAGGGWGDSRVTRSLEAEVLRLRAELRECDADRAALASVRACGVNLAFGASYSGGALLLACRCRPESAKSLGVFAVQLLAAAAISSVGVARAVGWQSVQPWMLAPPPPCIHFV
eukprot:SAG11_NODE_2239_length_3648_cov_4.089039_1_plen_238_part_00